MEIVSTYSYIATFLHISFTLLSVFISPDRIDEVYNSKQKSEKKSFEARTEKPGKKLS